MVITSLHQHSSCEPFFSLIASHGVIEETRFITLLGVFPHQMARGMMLRVMCTTTIIFKLFDLEMWDVKFVICL